MEVNVSGKPVSLTQRNVLGAGGEATVFSKGGTAYKIYHKPSTQKGDKLRALMGVAKGFPPEVLAPTELALSKSGKVVGYAMPLAPNDAEAVKLLANRNFRTANSIGGKQVAEIMLALGRVLEVLHPKGVVVGDLNDLNELFRGQEVYFVDSDSFQFGGYGCEVGTEDFLCPTLYDRALGGDSFSPETDWYSYAVLLYRSLLLVHPYGGVFPGLPNVTDRAKKKLTILDPTVKYPRLGASPEILTDELLEQFRLVFERGSYSKFPLALVEDYLDLLVPCSKCGEFFPATRGYCPRCSAPTVLPVATLAGRYIQSLLFETNGPIVFSKVLANAIFAVAFEEGQTVLYKWQAGKTERFPLFPKSHDLTFDIAMGKLVVGKKGQAKLLLVDPETGHLEKTETSLFSGWPSMAGTENHLYRLAGGLLLCSELFGTDLLDDVIGTVLPEQTWVGAHTDGQERVMTVSRIFERWLYQILFDGKCVDGEVSELEEGEKLVQLKVKFGGTNIVLIRQTKKNGRNYLRVDLLGKRGYKLKHYRRTWNEAKHGQIMQAAFSGETLVYYSEDSLVAENLITGKLTKFGGSENLLLGTETLYPWRGKILVVGENKATLIEKGG